MKYIDQDGEPVIIEGDIIIKEGDIPRKRFIGANYTKGVFHGGFLSSFNGTFDQELISIESDLCIIRSRIGNIEGAYELFKKKLMETDISDVFKLGQVIFETVDEYFGGIDNIEQRLNYYYDNDAGYELYNQNAISNLKGTGAAMCVERAALAQNLLRYLGINSFYKGSEIIKNGKREVHSYNVIEYQGKYYILDTSIPCLIDGKMNSIIAEIDKEAFQLISCPIQSQGISIKTSHYSPYRDADVEITYDSSRKQEIEVPSFGEGKGNHK